MERTMYMFDIYMPTFLLAILFTIEGLLLWTPLIWVGFVTYMFSFMLIKEKVIR